jgi:signal transduction histidine kinase
VTDEELDDRLRALHAATRELVRAGDTVGVCEVAAEQAEAVLGFDLNTVRLYDPERETLEPAAVSPAVERLLGERPTYGRGEAVQWEALEADEILVYPDVTEIDDQIDRMDTGSLLVAPLDGRGVLTVGSRSVDDISAADEELLGVFTANVAAALDRAERGERLRRRTAELARQNDRLEEFAGIIGHDLRNPLNTARGRLQLVAERDDPSDLAAVDDALDRMEEMIDRLLTLARNGKPVEATAPTSVAEVATAAWETSATAAATLSVDTGLVVDADRERLRTLFENLFRNAVDHAGTEVTVAVGELEDEEGFYVADDGPGLPSDAGEAVFRRGFTTDNDGTGFGLSIVTEVVDAHGWTIRTAEPGDRFSDGGARFEIVTSGDPPVVDD